MCVLAVLRRGGERRQVGSGVPGVETGEVAQDDLHRPGVDGGVVGDQREDGVLVVEAAEDRAQQRHAADADGVGGEFVEQFLAGEVAALLVGRVGRGQLSDLQRHRRGGEDPLVARLGVPDDGGAECLVPYDDVVEGGLQQRGFDAAAHPPAVDDVEAGAERSHVIALVPQAQELLLDREGEPLVRREVGDGHAALLSAAASTASPTA